MHKVDTEVMIYVDGFPQYHLLPLLDCRHVLTAAPATQAIIVGNMP